MTPLDVLNDLRAFLADKMTAYSGRTVDGKAIKCFTGFLPRAMTPEAKEKLREFQQVCRNDERKRRGSVA